MTAGAAPDVRPDRLLPLRRRLRRCRAARGARGTGHDRRVRDGDDPVHLRRHAHQAAGAGSQGWGHCGVRVPGGAADYRGQLRSRPAGLHRQAPRSVLRSSRRPPSGGLRRPGGEPHCRHRGRARRPHPTHRSGDHGTGAGHRGRRHARPAASGRPPSVRARDRTPGRRHGQPLGGTPAGQARPLWSSASMPPSPWRRPRSGCRTATPDPQPHRSTEHRVQRISIDWRSQ